MDFLDTQGNQARWIELPAQDRMPYREACEYVRKAIGADDEPEGNYGASALLARAIEGVIAVGAKRTECRIAQPNAPGKVVPFDDRISKMFTYLVFANYHSLPGQSGGENWSVSYINSGAGDFVFTSDNEEPRFCVTFSAWGMYFSRPDIESEFPPLTIPHCQNAKDAPANRQLDHDALIRRATEMRAERQGLSRGSAAASIIAELGPNPRTGRPFDNRNIERIIAPLWEGDDTSPR